MEEKITKYVTEKRAAVFLMFLAAFFAGNIAAACVTKYQGARENREAVRNEETEPPGGINTTDDVSGSAAGKEAAEASGTAVVQSAAEGNWGLSFQEEGKPPAANATFEELSKYNAYYAENTEEKRIYLTFDCGYENGNTQEILEALKKHQATATFFVVGNFVKDNPELVQQMLAEHHTVGNHTEHHPDMSQMADLPSFQKEISGLEALFQEATGQEISKYYRPPQGKYSEANLKMAQELGYKTFFWSLAYVDWYEDNQPTREEAFEKLLGRIHPGALVLLHNTSSTNAAILDELLTKWEEMGYSFGTLEELAASFV